MNTGQHDDATKMDTEKNPDRQFDAVDYTPSDADPAPDPADLKAGTLRMDLICVSTMTIYYLLSFLDRTNIGNAKVAGLQKDLGLTDREYAIALTVTYVPYIAFELPSNLILKKVGARHWLPLLVACWGVVTIGQGFVKGYGDLLVCRFFIGLFEGGLTPGVTLIMSEFYRRRQLHLRLALFFSMSSLAGALGGLIAYGITANLSGSHGIRGWSWIFIIEGAVTCGFALITYSLHLIPNSPESAWWLKPEHKVAIMHSLRIDHGAYVDKPKIDWLDSFSIFWTNPIAMALIIPSMCSGFIVFGTSYFAPSIVNGLGYDALRTQLFTVPPYALGFICAVGMSIISDRIGLRAGTTGLGGMIAAIGYCLQLTQREVAPRYVALFFQIVGLAIVAPAINSLNANNNAPTMRRAVAIAGLTGVMTNCGMISTWLYPTADGPYYRNGAIVGIVAGFTLFTAAMGIWTYIIYANKKRDQAIARLPADHVWPTGPLHDRDLRFRYTP